MTNTDPKQRNKLTTALICGLAAEVAMGSTLRVWLSFPSLADQPGFGRVGSIGVVVAAMILLALAMLVLVLARRAGTKVLLATVVVSSIACACVGFIAIAALFTDPGFTILLGFGAAMTIPITLAITRANALIRTQ